MSAKTRSAADKTVIRFQLSAQEHPYLWKAFRDAQGQTRKAQGQARNMRCLQLLTFGCILEEALMGRGKLEAGLLGTLLAQPATAAPSRDSRTRADTATGDTFSPKTPSTEYLDGMGDLLPEVRT
jgi:hypothetical protein